MADRADLGFAVRVFTACRAPPAGPPHCHRRCWHRHRRRRRYQPPGLRQRPHHPPSCHLRLARARCLHHRGGFHRRRSRQLSCASTCQPNAGGAACRAALARRRGVRVAVVATRAARRRQQSAAGPGIDEAIFLRKTQTITQEYLTREDAGEIWERRAAAASEQQAHRANPTVPKSIDVIMLDALPACAGCTCGGRTGRTIRSPRPTSAPRTRRASTLDPLFGGHVEDPNVREYVHPAAATEDHRGIDQEALHLSTTERSRTCGARTIVRSNRQAGPQSGARQPQAVPRTQVGPGGSPS